MSPILSLHFGCWQQRQNGKQSIAADVGESQRTPCDMCRLIARISWYFSDLAVSCHLERLPKWPILFLGRDILQFSRHTRRFFPQFLKLLPPDLLRLLSWFPSFSVTLFPRSVAPLRLQWSWCEVFLQEKGNLFWQPLNASCHYDTIPSEPVKKITINGIWLRDHVASEVWHT